MLVHSGCVHDSYQHIAATCQPAWFGSVSGGSQGSTYVGALYQSHCNSPDAEIGPGYCEPFDTLSTGRLTFTESDYEIDLMALVHEIGGNGLTGVGVLQIMGPASQTLGTVVGCTGLNASNDIIYKYPYEELAHNPDGTVMTQGGAVLYKDFARNPCTGDVVYSPNPPHTAP